MLNRIFAYEYMSECEAIFYCEESFCEAYAHIKISESVGSK
jgi:hypothetical protein